MPEWAGYRIAAQALLCAVLLVACSNQQIYTAVQQNRQLECQKLPGSQYEKCMAEVSEPYENYEREREALMEGKQETP